MKKSRGADWDGVTVRKAAITKQAVVMPDYVSMALGKGDAKVVLKWIHANQTEDRVNATLGAENMGASALLMASIINHLTLMTLLLQLGAEVVIRESQGITAKCMLFCDENTIGDVSDRVRLLLSWGTNFFSDRKGSKECCFI